MPQINLAPGTQYIVAARKRRRALFVLSAAIILLLVAIWLVMFVYERSLNTTYEQVSSKARSAQMEIARLEADANRVIIFESRLGALDELLDSHVSWDPILADLERLLPSDTILTFVTARQGESELSIQGSTADIDKVAQTLASLTSSPSRSTVFTKGTIQNAKRTEIGVEGQAPQITYDFTAALIFNPSVLTAKK